jgi:hypothetical protein
MEMLSIHPDNQVVIEDCLRSAAGKAMSQTVTTLDGVFRALSLVKGDLSRRFPVPNHLDLAVRYVHSEGLDYCLTTEMIFRRIGGEWYLDGVRKRNPLPHGRPWIKYLLEPYGYEVFWLYAHDRRSMSSVERTGGKLTAHQKDHLSKIADLLPRRRTKTRAF